MGLSAFSRARVSMLPELELEAKRFEEWNKTHQKSFRDLDELHSSEEAEEKVVAIRETMIESVKVIGEKAVAGLAENTAEGDPVDMPLRLDHVRDMVGRRHIVDPQGEPQSLIDRLHDRIPTSTTSEALVKKTSVDQPGPTAEEMEAAQEEQVPWGQEETELPEPGEGAGVKGEKGESGTPPNKVAVPKTTAAASPRDASKPADKELKK